MGYSPEKENGSGATTEWICDFIGLATRRQRSAGKLWGDLLHPGRGLFWYRQINEKFLRHSGFCRNFFSLFTLRPENFWDFQLLRQKFLDRPTFERIFFGIFSFRTEKNFRKLRSRALLF